MPIIRTAAHLATLTYRRDDGSEDVTQPLNEITEVGTPLDDETDELLDLVYVEFDTDDQAAMEIVPVGEHRWRNQLPRALHDALRDRTPLDEREALEISAALAWLKENESGGVLWSLLYKLFDDIQAISRLAGAPEGAA